MIDQTIIIIVYLVSSFRLQFSFPLLFCLEAPKLDKILFGCTKLGHLNWPSRFGFGALDPVHSSASSIVMPNRPSEVAQMAHPGY